MYSLTEFDSLLQKSNPMKIDYYQACFANMGMKGELANQIDKKGKEVIDSRVRMGLPPLDFEEEIAVNTMGKSRRKRPNFKPGKMST